MSEARRLADAIRELGASCADLAHGENGALSVLGGASSKLAAHPETAHLAALARSAAAEWGAMETQTKSAAIAAHRYAASLA